jgi:glycerate 2-kinase
MNCVALNALRAGILAADPRELMGKSFGELDASSFDRVFVIGAGKAGAGMALAAEELFDVSEGIVCVPRGTKGNTKRIKLIEAGHPFQNAGSVGGAKEILKLAGRVGKHDLALCLLSGGGSALMCLPREGITLQDKISVGKFLMDRGADISELNCVRKHLSSIKGGQLARVFSHCTLKTIIISDVVGDKLDIISSGPTVPDESTFLDAKDVLKKFNALEKFPKIARLVEDGVAGKIPENPRKGSNVFANSSSKIIGNNKTALLAASKVLAKSKIKHSIIENVTGEAKAVGKEMGRKLLSGESFVAGGETVVKVNGKGVGGRNCEVALACAMEIAGKKGICFASIGTDGIDGNSPAAGAIVDGKTVNDKRNAKLSLEKNDSYTFLKKKGCAIVTGLTGTNVNDIMVGIAKQKK